MSFTITPPPTVEATFHVEPHPDPLVRALVAEIERLRKALTEALNGTHSGKCDHHRDGGA